MNLYVMARQRQLKVSPRRACGPNVVEADYHRVAVRSYARKIKKFRHQMVHSVAYVDCKLGMYSRSEHKVVLTNTRSNYSPQCEQDPHPLH